MQCVRCKKQIDTKDLVIRSDSKNKNYNYHKECLCKYYFRKLKDVDKVNFQISKDINNTKIIIKKRDDEFKLRKFLENHYHVKLPSRWFTRDKSKIEILKNYRTDWFLEFLQNPKTQNNLLLIQSNRKKNGQEEICGYNLLLYELAILANKYHYFVKVKLSDNTETDKRKEYLEYANSESPKQNKKRKNDISDFLL